MQKKDRRTKRTHKAITQAFTELIIEKEFSEITVTELAERANINRKTFYSHYECIEDVLDELQVEIAERLVEIYRKHNKGPFDHTVGDTYLTELNASCGVEDRIASSCEFYAVGAEIIHLSARLESDSNDLDRCIIIDLGRVENMLGAEKLLVGQLSDLDRLGRNRLFLLYGLCDGELAEYQIVIGSGVKQTCFHGLLISVFAVIVAR